MENMGEGMGAFLGSGLGLLTAVGVAWLAHYFIVQREKREGLKKRVNMILALKAEFVSNLYLITLCLVQIEELQQTIKNNNESEIFPYTLEFHSSEEEQITAKYPAFIGSLGSNLSIQIRFLKELIVVFSESFSAPINDAEELDIAFGEIKELEEKFYNIDEKLVCIALKIIERENLTELDEIKSELLWEQSNPMSLRGEDTEES